MTVDERFELTEISQLVPGDSIVVSQTVVGPTGVNREIVSAKRTLDLFNPVSVTNDQMLDGIYEVFAVNFIGRTGTIDVNVFPGAELSGITTTGKELGYISWGRFNQVERDIDKSLEFVVDGSDYTPGMENYPTLVRLNEGLRDEGGLSKEL